MALPRSLRFRAAKEIPLVLRKGEQRHTPFFRVCSMRAMIDGTPEIAIVVSVKTEATAVGRHRLQRRLSAVLQHLLHEQNFVLPSRRYVFFPRPNVLAASFVELYESLRSYFLNVR